MLQRFVAASATASIAIAFGALALILMPALPIARIYPLTVVWCFVPLAWGIWALIAPAAWVPKRLPLWGAILRIDRWIVRRICPQPALSNFRRSSIHPSAGCRSRRYGCRLLPALDGRATDLC